MQGLLICRAALQQHFSNVLLVVAIRWEVVVEIIAGGEELLIGLQKKKKFMSSILKATRVRLIAPCLISSQTS